jgi:hypothetical protein
LQQLSALREKIERERNRRKMRRGKRERIQLVGCDGNTEWNGMEWNEVIGLPIKLMISLRYMTVNWLVVASLDR